MLLIRQTQTLWQKLTGSHRAILTNALSLVGTTAVTSGLGFIYWWVAARLFPVQAVGLASAAISSMTLLGTIGMLGLGTLLMGELPRQPLNKGSLVVTALLIAGVVGMVLGVIFALATPLISSDLSPISQNIGNVLLFGVGVAFTALTLVLDQALIGLLRGDLQLWRNALFAGGKLVALAVAGLVLSDQFGMNIYLTWFAGNLFSLAILAGLAVRKGIKLNSCRLEWNFVRHLGRTSLAHHGLNLALLAPGLLLPLMVTALLSATANAHFYVAWMVAAFVFVGPGSLTTVLYAVNAANPSALAHKIRFTLKLAFVLGVVENLGLLIVAGPLLNLFGHDYAEQAGWTLTILALGTFPTIVKDHYVAIYRIHGEIAGAAFRVALMGLLELTSAIFGAGLNGLVGFSLGWLIGLSLEALFMVRAVYRAAQKPILDTGEELNEQRETELAYAGLASES